MRSRIVEPYQRAFEGGSITLDDLRRYAVARSLFRPTTLSRAFNKLGFVQADPIRAPARAQDLILRHRVTNYRAGDLERRYSALGLAEDFFVNYGFVTAEIQALMHPRAAMTRWSATRKAKAQALLAFIRERSAVHPRDVDAHFSHGAVTNYWGGSSNATTHLLDGMHYRGLLRVARRENGVRLYSAHEHAPAPLNAASRRDRIDALVDVIVGIYAPLPAVSLSGLVSRLRYAVPQWRRDLTSAVIRAKQRLAHARVDGVDWYWPTDEHPASAAPLDAVRLLAPFDPVVWDRRRFEIFWGWAYRFEAYTPATKRQRGYYALPLLWQDRVIGWGNIAIRNGALKAVIGYVHSSAPKEQCFKREMEAELDRMRAFLGVASAKQEPP
ncbi:MAG: crosslink repair DNA glycosylase YcaQ family protein [Burkholderiaceae bacterium]